MIASVGLSEVRGFVAGCPRVWKWVTAPVKSRTSKDNLGEQSLQDLRMWHLYGGWFGFDYVWEQRHTKRSDA